MVKVLVFWNIEWHGVVLNRGVGEYSKQRASIAERERERARLVVEEISTKLCKIKRWKE